MKSINHAPMPARSADRQPATPKAFSRELGHAVTVRFAAALLVIMLLAGLSCAVTWWQVHRDRSDDMLVNESGRQRMLVTRCALLTQSQASSSDPVRRAQLARSLHETLESFEQFHDALWLGDRRRKIPPAPEEVRRILAEPPYELNRRVNTYIETIRRILESPDNQITMDNKDVQYVISTAMDEDFMASLDALVSAYQSFGEEHLTNIQLISAALLLATLGALVFIAVFIFVPLARRVCLYTKRLELANTRLDAQTNKLTTTVTEFEQNRNMLEERSAAVQHLFEDLNNEKQKLVAEMDQRRRTEVALQEKEAQLRQKQKLEAIGSLAGGIAHEFNNLLQAIRGYTSFALEELDPSGQPYQDLQHTLSAADRAARLTSQLLGYSRRHNLQRVELNPNEVVSEMTDMVRPLIGEQIDLELNLADDAGLVNADPTMLQQMLMNLCVNARDAMPSGGQLSVKTSRTSFSTAYCDIHTDARPGQYVQICVTDTGCGMPAEVMQRIFDPFFTTKDVGKGTGLGLAMVYGVVQQHEGLINVYSEEGLGTTFKLYLPALNDQSEQEAADAHSADTRGTETILFADDDPLMRMVGLCILTEAGYEVLTANDGLQAVNLYREYSDRISLMLLDIVMPEQNGHGVYEQISILNPDIKAVFCTGYDPETVQKRNICRKGVPLVEKPFDPEELLRTIRLVLDQEEPCKVPQMQN